MNKPNDLTFTGVDHPAVAADDVEALANWYCDVIGYEKWHFHPKPVWMLKAPDGSLLEVMPKDDTPRPERTTWTPGWSHVAFRVEDIDKAVEWLEANGVTWTGNTVEAIGGGKVRTCVDPEGNMIQVLQREPRG